MLAYAQGRVPKTEKCLVMFSLKQTCLLTGANADTRVPATPSQQKVVLAKLYGKLFGTSVGGDLPTNLETAVDRAGFRIIESRF